MAHPWRIGKVALIRADNSKAAAVVGKAHGYARDLQPGLCGHDENGKLWVHEWTASLIE